MIGSCDNNSSQRRRNINMSPYFKQISLCYCKQFLLMTKTSVWTTVNNPKFEWYYCEVTYLQLTQTLVHSIERNWKKNQVNGGMYRSCILFAWTNNIWTPQSKQSKKANEKKNLWNYFTQNKNEYINSSYRADKLSCKTTIWLFRKQIEKRSTLDIEHGTW